MSENNKKKFKDRILRVYILSILVMVFIVNWDAKYSEELIFYEDNQSVSTDYNSVNGSLKVIVSQSKGDSTNEYTFYYKKRTSNKYEIIASNISFDQNDEPMYIGNCYAGIFADTQIIVKKTNGLDKESKLMLLL